MLMFQCVRSHGALAIFVIAIMYGVQLFQIVLTAECIRNDGTRDILLDYNKRIRKNMIRLGAVNVVVSR